MSLRCLPYAFALVLASLACPPANAQESTGSFDPAWFEGLHWREVGPYRGGRSAAVCGLPSDPDTYYFGATGGGVWKTRDAGRTWDAISDGHFGGSIGAVAVSEWDPNVIYVGEGEKTVRGNVSHGDGVWKSTDAGKTWKHVGLADSRHVPRIRIHPRDPDLVYAASLGHLFGPNEERGVFRSKDGGANWERVLFVNENAGCVDLAMDPTNPRVLYACFWRVRRTPYSLESGGEGSTIWKTTDGGDTWTELTRNPGLPAGERGISGIAVSASDPENLYAIVESEKGGVFRSRDGGETWTKTNEDRELRQRAWYYTRIYADPADAESCYVLNVRFHRSQDGGKSFAKIDTPHGDNHDLWIAPDEPLRMIQSNDGGANVTFDGGETWSVQSNQPTAQMYRVSTDDDFPYRLLGGQQDNSAVRIRSRSLGSSSIGQRDWEPTAGGESGHIVAKPGAPHIVYGGSYGGTLVRLDHETGERRSVQVWPDDPMGWGAAELKYRFQWNFPLFFSPHDADTLYAAANVLFVTRDEGASWQEISPDLTRDDKDKMGPSGGPITKDNTSVEYYGTIFAAFESPLAAGVLWCGSDDGLVHMSRDGGASWQNVTPPTLPEWTQINSLEPHPFEEGGCYLTGTRYKLDDFEPYLFRTSDWGASWERIDAGIPRDHFTRVLRADDGRRGLLFAGTERGAYVSLDDGSSWQSLQLDLPITPITDMALAGGDLVVATQGRGYWILDDLSPLRQLDPGTHQGSVHLFAPRPALRLGMRRSDEPGSAGTNPLPGAVIDYMLPDELGEETDVSLEVYDPRGELVRAFEPEPAPGEEPEPLPEEQTEDPRQLPTEKGFNRFAWDLSYPGAEKFPGMVLWNRRLGGPRAVPGTYRVVLSVGDERQEVEFEVRPDPRASATQADYEAQFDFQLRVRDDLTQMHRGIRRLRDTRSQLKEMIDRLGGGDEDDGAEEAAGEHARVVEAAEALVEQLDAIEETLYQTKNESPQDPLNYPIRLGDKLSGLLSSASVGDNAPTAQAEAVREELGTAIAEQLGELDALFEGDLPALNQLAEESRVPAVLPTRVETDPAEVD